MYEMHGSERESTKENRRVQTDTFSHANSGINLYSNKKLSVLYRHFERFWPEKREWEVRASRRKEKLTVVAQFVELVRVVGSVGRRNRLVFGAETSNCTIHATEEARARLRN